MESVDGIETKIIESNQISPRMLFAYRTLLESKKIFHDEFQLEVVKRMHRIQESMMQTRVSSSNWLKIKRLFENYFNGSNKGLYLYGDVGSGKSMLMRMFYDTCHLSETEKYRCHWDSLIQFLHSKLFQIQYQRPNSKESLMNSLVQHYFADKHLVCIDEIQRPDAVNENLVKNFMDSLLSRNIYVVATSNRHPSQLQLDPVDSSSRKTKTRDITDVIMNHFDVISLNSENDYRKLKNTSCRFQQRAFFFPSSDISERKSFEFMLDSILAGRKLIPQSLPVIGTRLIEIDKSSDLSCNLNLPHCAVFDAVHFLTSNYGPQDLISMCQKYDYIFLRDLPLLQPFVNRDNCRTFITFIDAAYNSNSKIIILAVSSMDCIFQAPEQNHHFISDEEFAINRTISRLHEMSSPEFLNSIRSTQF